MSKIRIGSVVVTGVAGITGLILVAVMFAAVAAFYGWLVMLGFGIVHSFAAGCPAIGFLPAWGLGAILALIIPNNS